MICFIASIILAIVPIQIASAGGSKPCKCNACDLWEPYSPYIYGSCQDGYECQEATDSACKTEYGQGCCTLIEYEPDKEEKPKEECDYYCTQCDLSYPQCGHGYECVDTYCSRKDGKGCCKKTTNECDYCERCNLQYTKDKQCPSGMYCEASCGTNTLYGCCKYMDKSSSSSMRKSSSSERRKSSSSSKRQSSSSETKKSWTNDKSQSLYKAEAGSMHFDENVETADTDNHDWNGWVAFIVVASITLLLNVITFSVIYKCCLKKKGKNVATNYEGLSNGMSHAGQVEDFSDDSDDDDEN